MVLENIRRSWCCWISDLSSETPYLKAWYLTFRMLKCDGLSSLTDAHTHKIKALSCLDLPVSNHYESVAVKEISWVRFIGRTAETTLHQRVRINAPQKRSALTYEGR